MNTRRRITIAYLCLCIFVTTWFWVAAANGWRAANFGFLDGSSSGGSSGRSFGGSWGGGK